MAKRSEDSDPGSRSSEGDMVWDSWRHDEDSDVMVIVLFAEAR